MSIFQEAPEPPTELGRYRILSKTAGIRVSPLQLGAMSIGEAWKDFMGSMDKEASFKLLDAYYELAERVADHYQAGGNFIDTSSNYQNEESELWIGEWMQKRGNRDEMVIATKYTTLYPANVQSPQKVNFCGNHRKNLHMSVRDSLKKLQTDYIDILYMHWLDWTTSVEEVMDSLDAVVKSGKVLYLGISDTPAWWVSAANQYAKLHGKTQFSMYQGRWNVILRDFEREILPLARYWGMAICPWDSIGGGKFQSKKALEERKKNNEGLRSIMGQGQSEDQVKISEALEEVAKEHGDDISVTAIALAYVMSKAPRVFPIVGGRKVEHLKDNIKALKIKLTDKQIEKLESVKQFDVGFPSNFVGEDPHTNGGQLNFLMNSVAKLSFVESEKAIGHE